MKGMSKMEKGLESSGMPMSGMICKDCKHPKGECTCASTPASSKKNS
jgi:hypothetical protein